MLVLALYGGESISELSKCETADDAPGLRAMTSPRRRNLLPYTLAKKLLDGRLDRGGRGRLIGENEEPPGTALTLLRGSLFPIWHVKATPV